MSEGLRKLWPSIYIRFMGFTILGKKILFRSHHVLKFIKKQKLRIIHPPLRYKILKVIFHLGKCKLYLTLTLSYNIFTRLINIYIVEN